MVKSKCLLVIVRETTLLEVQHMYKTSTIDKRSKNRTCTHHFRPEGSKKNFDKFPPVPGGDVPMAGKKLLQGWIGDDHEPNLRLAEHAEQGHLLVHQDHVVVVQQEKNSVLQSSL